jgi:hypothetical protein
MTEESKDRLSKEFKDAHTAVSECFGDLSFMIFDEDRSVLSRFNSALYDSQMVGISIAIENSGKVKVTRKDAAERMLRLFKNENYLNYISRATSDDKSVKGRINLFTEAFSG